MPESDRELEVVLWGATGFTGRLVAEFLATRHGDGLRWALGGRDRRKLEDVRRALRRPDLPLLVGDGEDEAFLATLAARTRVVCTTVGPYARHGSKLVAACARSGSDYCDLAGEVPWMRRMIDAHEKEARESGARIVHACGFDSVPSDLGVAFLQREARRRFGSPCPSIAMRAMDFRGGFSGGTVASMLAMLDEAEHDASVRRLLADPYALAPRGEVRGPDGPDAFLPRYDERLGGWTGPFVMAGINTRIVRRTNALLDYAYGRDFRYEEAMWLGAGALGLAQASALSFGQGLAMALGSLAPLRRGLERLLPAPGEGPSKARREAGFYDLAFLGEHAREPGRVLRARVTGDRDPGYGSTSKMLGEAAVCLARDALPVGGGFWTPASAMAEPLLERLQAHAGLTFELVD